MYSAIPAWTLNFVAFSLIVLCLIAGQYPSLLPSFALVSLNATNWKSNLTTTYTHADQNFTGIHDIYNVYMTTYCKGYNGIVLNLACSKPSSYAKFLPDLIIDKEVKSLNINVTDETDISRESVAMIFPVRSRHTFRAKDDEEEDEAWAEDGDEDGDNQEGDKNEGMKDIDAKSTHFPEYIQLVFERKYNSRFHTAFIFYVVGLVFSGLALTIGISAFRKGTRGFGISLLTFPASICWMVSSLIVGQSQKQLEIDINNPYHRQSNTESTPVVAIIKNGIRMLTWTAFSLVCLSTLAWPLASIVSWDYRKNRKRQKGRRGSKKPKS